MKGISYFILCCILFTCQSCFEIVEQLYVKADGSGNMILTLNFSKSKTKLNGIMKMKTVNGHNVPSQQEVTTKIKEIEKQVAKTVGISAAKTTADYDNFIFTLACNFTKVEQLNTVVKNIAESQNSKTKITEKIYTYNTLTNTLSRLNKYTVKKDYNKMSNADKEIFATANYTSIYKFDNSIASFSNKEATPSPSKKAIMLKQNVLDVIVEKKTIENTITLIK